MSFDSWGVSWKPSWGVSWVHPDVAPTVTTTPIIGGGGYHPSQGLGNEKRTRKQLSEARKRFDLEDELALKQRLEAERIIQDVALRQAQRLELDKQKQFEELSRELRLNKIEWEGRFLEALNAEREKLIDREIAQRLRFRVQEENDLMALMVLAASL